MDLYTDDTRAVYDTTAITVCALQVDSFQSGTTATVALLEVDDTP